MKFRTLFAVNAALLGAFQVASGETVNYLSTAPANWTAYAASPLPVLNTTAPGSIVDSIASGSSAGRLNTPFTAYPGLWRPGDTFVFQIDGVLSNSTTFRAEFTDAAHAVALQLVLANGNTSGADVIQINALGGSSALLFNGNLGGAGGVGTSQRVTGNLTLSILTGTTASVSGSIGDSLGTLWSGPSANINLGTAPAAIYAGAIVTTSGGLLGINTLSWSATPVPEPGSIALFAGLGLAGLWVGRRARQKV